MWPSPRTRWARLFAILPLCCAHCTGELSRSNSAEPAPDATWYTASAGAYLRVWKNEHAFSCAHPHGELTYAGKQGGPPEITCRCDADLDPVTGLSKTSPPGADGFMPAVASSRGYLEGNEVVVIPDP